MKRITILGTAVATALVFAALAAATSASASSAFLTEPASTSTLEGSATGTTVITTNVGEIECAGPSLSGTGTTMMPAMTLAMSSADCTGASDFSPNGCDQILHPGTEVSEGAFQGTIEIGPAGCGPITFSSLGCTVEIGAQSGIPATIVNSGEGSEGTVSVSLQGAEFTYNRSGSCGTGTQNGSLTADWHVSAKTAGEQIGLHASGDLSNGLHLSTLFEAERYPAGLGGTENEFVFETETGEVECMGAQFSGELAKAGVVAVLTPSYPGGCLMWGLEATPHTNGCRFAFAAQGGVGLDCPPNKALEFEMIFCTVSIPEQFLGSATFENVGSGTGEKVKASYSGSSLQYSYSGSWCGSGEAENGSLYPAISLINAFNPYQ